MNFLNYFTETYFFTTNPKNSLSDILFYPPVYVSSFLHSLVYSIIFSITFKLYEKYYNKNDAEKDTIEILDYDFILQLFKILLVIMCLGYYGRFLRLKSLYEYLEKNNQSKNYEMMRDTAYFRYYFLA